jgi:CHAD domain-containing protein
MKSDLAKKRFAFPIRATAAVHDALLQSLRAQNDKIIYLAMNYSADPVTAIHEIRKSFKRLRSVSALMKPVMPDEAKAWNGLWRDCSRTLSSGREICVRIDSIRLLTGNQPDFKPLIDTAVAIRNRIISAIDAEGVISSLKVTIDSSRDQLSSLVPGGLEPHMLEDGLLGTYEKAKFQLDKALFSTEPDDLHELRKRCKKIQYHCELMSRLNPELKNLNKTISQNTELLGLYNDLHDLEIWGSASHEVISDDIWFRLVELIKRRKTGLRDKAMRQISDILRQDSSGYLEMYSEFIYA